VTTVAVAVEGALSRDRRFLVVAAERLPAEVRAMLGHPSGNGTIALPLEARDPAPVLRLVSAHYDVHVAPRRIPLAGATNFRDAGGLPAAGGSLPWRWRYRSENLARLTSGDWDVLERLDIRLILDLRTPEEVAGAPTRAPSFVEVRRLPMSAPLAGAADATEAILAGRLRRVTPDDLVEHYRFLVATSSERLVEIATLLQTHPAPLVVHCTAGKDRTGLVVALWQLAAGASFVDVVEDYALSTLLRTVPRFLELRDRIAAAGTDPREVRPYLTAHVPALLVALELLETGSRHVGNLGTVDTQVRMLARDTTVG